MDLLNTRGTNLLNSTLIEYIPGASNQFIGLFGRSILQKHSSNTLTELTLLQKFPCLFPGGYLHTLNPGKQSHNLLVSNPTQRSQQQGSRHFLSMVESDVDYIVGIIFKFDPRTAVGYNPRREKPPSTGMNLVREDDTRRTVQLTDNNALSAIYNECSRIGHERKFTHVNVLLSYIHYTFGTCFFIFLLNNEFDFYLQGGSVCHPSFLTLQNIVFRLA